MSKFQSLAATLLIFLAAAPARPQPIAPAGAAAARDPRRYTIDEASVRVADLGPIQSIKKSPAIAPGSDAQAEPSLSEIVNVGLKAWKIFEDNRPVVDVSRQFATALPKGVGNWTRMARWSQPEGRIYELSARNLYGQEVVYLRYQVLREFGGSYQGRGKYLTAVTIEPLAWEVKWGFHFTLDAAVPETSIVNVGSAADPVAGLLTRLTWRIDTPVKMSSGENLYFLQGDGAFREVGGPRITDASSPFLENVFRGELNADQLRRLGGEARLEDMLSVMTAAQRTDLRLHLSAAKATTTDAATLADVARAERMLDQLGSMRSLAAENRLRAGDFAGATNQAGAALADDPGDARARFAFESARGRVSATASAAAKTKGERFAPKRADGNLPLRLPVKVRMDAAVVPALTAAPAPRKPWAPFAAALALAAAAIAAARAAGRQISARRLAVVIGVPVLALILISEGPVILAAAAAAFEPVALPEIDAALSEAAAEAEVLVSKPSLPWTTWEGAQKAAEGGRLYARIGERLYTEHAVERMMPRGLSSLGRSVPPSAVEYVIQSGDKFSRIVDGITRVIHRSGNIEVITEQADKIIVTVKRI
jgi:hypothetical protein